jgi:hypothetical protein
MLVRDRGPLRITSMEDCGARWLAKAPEHGATRRLRNPAETQLGTVDQHAMEGDLPVRLRNGVDAQMSDCIDFPTANILSGNTLAAPKFKDGESLRTCDYLVANPPFSDKTSSTGLAPANGPFR